MYTVSNSNNFKKREVKPLQFSLNILKLPIYTYLRHAKCSFYKACNVINRNDFKQLSEKYIMQYTVNVSSSAKMLTNKPIDRNLKL